MRFYRVLPLLLSISVAAAELRLSPEQRVAPLAMVQGSVGAASRSGHVLAAWRSAGKVLDFSFDGVVLADARFVAANSIGAPPVVVAGARTFLVAWAESESLSYVVRARRFSTDGTNLDVVPYDLCRVSGFLGLAFHDLAVFDGDAFIVACTDREINGEPFTRIIRMTESGSVTDGLRPRIAQPEVRPLLANGQLMFSGASYAICSNPVYYACAQISVYGLNEASVPVFRTQAVAWAAAAGPDRVLVAILPYSGERFGLAQTSFGGGTIRDVYRPLELASVPVSISNAGAMVWNGSEYVLVWAENALLEGNRVRGIRLNRAGDPIDSTPFTISGPGRLNTYYATPSLSVTETGVLITYSRTDEGGATYGYMRTLERLPSGSRRTSVRH
jgi:hypothetical protein